MKCLSGWCCNVRKIIVVVIIVCYNMAIFGLEGADIKQENYFLQGEEERTLVVMRFEGNADVGCLNSRKQRATYPPPAELKSLSPVASSVTGLSGAPLAERKGGVDERRARHERGALTRPLRAPRGVLGIHQRGVDSPKPHSNNLSLTLRVEA